MKKVLDPVAVRQGQMVELTVSFATVAAGTGQHFLIKLNRVLVVNCHGSWVCFNFKMYIPSQTQTDSVLSGPGKPSCYTSQFDSNNICNFCGSCPTTQALY